MRTLKILAAPALLFALAFTLAPPASAQVYPTAQVDLIPAVTNIAGSTTITLADRAFPLRQGTGAAFVPVMVATNTTTDVVTFTFQLGQIDRVNTRTNWSTVGSMTYAPALNSTTTSVAYTNVPATVLNNVDLIRLRTIVNPHTNTITISNVWMSVSSSIPGYR